MMRKVLTAVFSFFLILAIASAFCIIAIQIVSIITVNGTWAVWAKDTLETPVCVFCSLSAFVAFFLSYINKSSAKQGEDDD
jgi:hypothetical protein